MPLNTKGKKNNEIYESNIRIKKGEEVFYASLNKGKIKRVKKKNENVLVVVKNLDHHQKKGAYPQGITVSNKRKKNSNQRLTSLVLLMAKVIFHTRKQKRLLYSLCVCRNDR